MSRLLDGACQRAQASDQQFCRSAKAQKKSAPNETATNFYETSQRFAAFFLSSQKKEENHMLGQCSGRKIEKNAKEI